MLSGCIFVPSSAPATNIDGVDIVSTLPMSEDDYVAEFSSRVGWLSFDEFQAEYREAAAVFPLILPESYAFPVDLVLPGLDDRDGEWEAGSGAAQAFFVWDGATATAAYAAHERGDDALATSLLDAYEAGHTSPRAEHVSRPGATGRC